MLIKTLLNKTYHFKSFIYKSVEIQSVNGSDRLIIDISERGNSKARGPLCGKRCASYDRQAYRLLENIPIWSFKVFFRYAPRRMYCPDHGIKVEELP